MVSLTELRSAIAAAPPDSLEYVCLAGLNLYQSPACQSLVTQAAAGRHLKLLLRPNAADLDISAMQARLCDDNYSGWLALSDLAHLAIAQTPYQPISLSFEEIQARLPAVIAFTQTAMAQPNHYLWGGTLGPHYDCSGLIQAAFASVGVSLPRDSYQQEAFTHAIPLEALQPGDLIFFGSPQKTSHVALYLGQGDYIHSSGKDQGRNGVGIDSLSDLSHPVSHAYARQLRGAGRVMTSYQ